VSLLKLNSLSREKLNLSITHSINKELKRERNNNNNKSIPTKNLLKIKVSLKVVVLLKIFHQKSNLKKLLQENQ